MRILSLLLTGALLLHADFSYEQRSKMTGGALMGAMKFAGAFSKKLREPDSTWTYVKGNKIAHVSGTSAQVFDIDAETVTEINFEKRTYAVMTFAQMAQAMAEMKAKMGEAKADVSFQVDGKETGRKKQLAGHPTSEFLVSFVTVMKDKKGKDQAEMETQMSSWMAADLPGYDEMMKAHQKLGAKMAGSMSPMMGQGMPGMQPGMNESWATLAEKMKNMKGVPMLQVVRMGPKGQLPPSSTMGDPKPVKEEAAAEKPKASDVLAGALGGRLGGFGRKRKDENREQMPNPQTPAAKGEGGEGGMLMEMTTETLQVSSAPVDVAKFQVPAGFQQVEHDMVKALNKKR